MAEKNQDLTENQDLNELIAFSLDNDEASAIVRFPMFTTGQIQKLYDMPREDRESALYGRWIGHRSPAAERKANGPGGVPEPPVDPRIVKMMEIENDPSNR